MTRLMELRYAAACIAWLGIKSVAVTGADPGTVASVAAWLSSRDLGLSVDERYGAPCVDLVVECPEELEEGQSISSLSVRTRLPIR